jgi:hypothetical protein
MTPIVERVRELLRTVEPWHVAAALLVVAIAAMALPGLGDGPPGQRAIGQETTEETTATPAPAEQDEPPPPDLTPASDQYLAGEEPAGIPGLSPVEVVAGVGVAPPGVALSCTGPQPERGEVLSWNCRGSKPPVEEGGAPAEFLVEVVGADATTALYVSASVYRATDAEAAEFLAYVAGLAVEEPSPLDTQAWVRGNLASGGSTSSDGAGLELYGYEDARVLEVVASGR